MTERVKRGGNSPDYQAMFLGDVLNGQDIEDGQALIWDEAQERFAPGAAGGAASYLVYTAVLNQSDTDAPVPVVLRNTLGGTPVFLYDGVGAYICDLSGISFPENSVIFIPVDSINYGDSLVVYVASGVSAVNLFSFMGTDMETPADTILSDTPFEFRVYTVEPI